MKLLNRSAFILTLGTLICVGGCSQYNGAISFTPEQEEEIAAYHQRQQTGASTTTDNARGAAAATTTSAPSTTAMRPGAAFTDIGAPSASGAASASEPARTRDPNVTALGLFGQLPVSVKGESSPLDSPNNVRQVTFSTEGADFDPAIDPKGQWIAFASTRHRATSDIYLKRIGGSAITQLTNDPGNDVMPTFSPDGKRIAFASDRSGNWDIYVVDVDGGQAIQLTNDATHDIHPSFSPDGKWLVYSTYGEQSGQWELALIEVANPATRRIIGHGLFPTWSPIDNRIVFQRARQRGTRWFSIWTIELEQGEARRPTEIAVASNAATITPRFSPDGRFIVFSTVVDPDGSPQAKPAQADVWIIASDGSGRANLTHSPFANLQPTWGPDNAIYFVSNRGQGGIENVWSITPDRARAIVDATRNSNGMAAKTATPGAPAAGATAADAAGGAGATIPPSAPSDPGAADPGVAAPFAPIQQSTAEVPTP